MLKIFITSLLAMNTYAAIGNDAGGGGKTEELEFTQVAQIFSSNLDRSLATEDLFKDFDSEAFQTAISKTEIKARENLCSTETDLTSGSTRTHCLDAQYLPEKNLIEVSLNTWKGKKCIEKMGLVVHEYGRAASIEDGNYKYSSRVAMSNVMINACANYYEDTASSVNDLPDQAGAWLLAHGTQLVPKTNIVLPAKTQSFLICGNQLTTSEESVPSFKGCEKVPIQNSDYSFCLFSIGVVSHQSKVWSVGKGLPMSRIQKRNSCSGCKESSEGLYFDIPFGSRAIDAVEVQCNLNRGRDSYAMSLGELKAILGQFFQIVQPAPEEI